MSTNISLSCNCVNNIFDNNINSTLIMPALSTCSPNDLSSGNLALRRFCVNLGAGPLWCS